jgi:hypothetical protein
MVRVCLKYDTGKEASISEPLPPGEKQARRKWEGEPKGERKAFLVHKNRDILLNMPDRLHVNTHRMKQSLTRAGVMLHWHTTAWKAMRAKER